MMLEDHLRVLLAKVASGETHIDSAMETLRSLPYEDLGFAKVDQHRQIRQGMPEVIFCPGKTSRQICDIAASLRTRNDLVLATRASVEIARETETLNSAPTYFPDARTLAWGNIPTARTDLGTVAIVTAGTSDLPVAYEADLILRASAIQTEIVADVGVAGLHRVLDCLPSLRTADVCIVIAGMDGVLPSVIGGLLACPVIACPSSVGYGAAFEGLAALLTMLNSCAAGVTVVNIDNGFGAAVAAFRILMNRK